MTIFSIIFLNKILAKYSLKYAQIASFLKIFSSEHALNPLANAWLCHALHGAARYANTSTFPEKI